MGVVQNSIDIQKIIEAGGDPTIAAKVAELEAEIGDENSGIIKDIDDLQEANALIMTSVSAIKTTADSAKVRADQSVLWSERKGYVGKNIFNYKTTDHNTNSVSYTYITEGVNVKSTSDGNWRNLALSMKNYNKGAAYNFSCICDYVGGAALIAIKGSDHPEGGGTTIRQTDPVTEDHNFSLDFNSGNYDYINIQFFVTAGNGGSGEANFTNIMIKLASISDGTYEPYLPNNNELLQTATLKSVTASAADFASFQTAIAAL